MKIQMLFLLLSLVAPESFSQENKSDQAFTRVYHYRNSISVKNFDGTRSTIHVNGNSATLLNADGTISTMDFCGNSSKLMAIDGTSSSISHNGFSSTVFNSDGTQTVINHNQNTSFCFTPNGKHTIMHTFGDMKERRNKDIIDVLIHINWLIQQKTSEATDEISEEETQN